MCFRFILCPVLCHLVFSVCSQLAQLLRLFVLYLSPDLEQTLTIGLSDVEKAVTPVSHNELRKSLLQR
jgi:hypothetical protein